MNFMAARRLIAIKAKTANDNGAGPAFSRGAGAEFAKGPGEPGLVSVVIPTYNRGYIVTRAIDSVLAQTYRPVEMLVVDDGSTDDTATVVGRYGPEVRYFSQPNGGVSAARNHGLMEARGEFIALLDSDDAWENWKLQAQVSILRAMPQAGMVWTDMAAIDGDCQVIASRYLRKMYGAHDIVKIEDICNGASQLSEFWPDAPAQIAAAAIYVGNIFPYMLLGNLVHTSTVLLRRERLRATGLFDTDLRYSGEDYEFHFRMASHGPVELLDTPGIRYRVGSTDQLTQPEFVIHIARNNLTTVLRYFKPVTSQFKLSPSVVIERVAASYAWVGEAELMCGQNRKAAANLWQSFCLKPKMRIACLLGASQLPPALFQAFRRFRNSVRRLIVERVNHS